MISALRTIAQLLGIAAICIILIALTQNGNYERELFLKQIGRCVAIGSFGVYALSVCLRLCLFKSRKQKNHDN